MPKQINSRGFSLIELMIVIGIIAILTSIAYPSYIDSVRKSRRATAQADLLELANFMERRFTETNAYPLLDSDLPFEASPRTGTLYYALDLDASSSISSFTLQATPSGSQTADSCGTLTLSQTGAQTPTTNCW